VVTRATDYGNPHEDLHRADPGISGGLYDRLVALYEHFRSPAPRARDTLRRFTPRDSALALRRVTSIYWESVSYR
jgi:hypothetical protein